MVDRLIRLLPVLVCALVLALMAGSPSAMGAAPDGPPGLVRALLAQDRHTEALMSRADVHGTGVGQNAAGEWVVVVYMDRPGAAGLPARLDRSVGVEVRVTGRIDAFQPGSTVANFTFNCIGLTCSFDGSSSSKRGSASYSWQLGDGSVRSGVSISHTYAASGSYQVTLTVTSSVSGTDSETKTVTVQGSSGGGGGGGGTDCASGATQVRCVRPVPIGVSIGHPSITAGTLGARVKDGLGNVFVLSNNHVLANSNAAALGDGALQPGPYDGGQDPADRVGQLSDFQPITFNSTSTTNVMDAAIAATTTAMVGAATHAGGYGVPSASPVTASVGTPVRKQGRTTGDTTGSVSAINVTLDVCYAGFATCTSWARFVNQIAIGPGTFSAGGDSGSLIVTHDGQNAPVGLLFAGSSTTTFANPIEPVLSRFGIAIDGAASGSPPVADAGGPYVGTEDEPIAFDGSASSDPDGDSLTYAWSFGDGATGTGPTPSHTYLWGGTFQVSLEVNDGNGNKSTATTQAAVAEVNDVPVAVAGGPYVGSPGTPIAFDGSGSYDFDNLDGTTANDQVLTYEWDFGDGATGSGAQTSHAYAASGDYVVTLTVSDGLASSAAETMATVSAAPAPLSVTGISPNSIKAGTSMSAAISGTGFAPGASVTFSGGSGPAPTASGIVVSADGQTVNLVIAAPSGGPPRNRTWNVVVTNPGGASAALNGGLTVTP